MLLNSTLRCPLGHARYERHRPEQTLLCQLVEKHYPALVEQLEIQSKNLPAHVHQEFEVYLKCGRLEDGSSACVAINVTSSFS